MSLLLMFGCSSNAEEDYTEAEEKISEAFGLDMSIIDPEGHSLNFVKLHSTGPFDEKIEKVSLGFSNIEGEKENTRTEEEINSEEDSLNMEYLYGPYDGNVNFHTTITYEDKLSLIDPNVKFNSKEVVGQTVHYLERNDSQELILRTFFDDVMYKVEVNLTGDITKEDAFDYMENIIAKMNN